LANDKVRLFLKRYPLVKQKYVEDHIPQIGKIIFESDFFYLDVNGIIYKCVKDESTAFKDLVKSKKFSKNYTRFEEIWILILNYLNYLIKLINPKKVLFIALDGTIQIK
jgi:5'-3' exoribonuclease 1